MRIHWNYPGRQAGGERHVLIVGLNDRAEHLARMLTDKGSDPCSIEGFVDDDPERQAILEARGGRYLGTIADLDRLLIERVIDCVYVCLPLQSSYDTAQHVLTLCGKAGVTVLMVTDLLPWRATSGTMWCTEPHHTAELVERPQREPVFALEFLRAGTLAPFFTALSAVFFGLISGMLLFS